MNPELPLEQRIEDLLAQMTIDEKIGQLNQIYANTSNTEEIRQYAREGRIGSRILASTALAGSEEQHTADLNEGNEAQRICMEESRLGIPLMNGRDIIHGHRTVFPVPLAAAASWNPELVEKSSSIAAREASAAGIHWTFAPMLDIARDPRWGRIIEGFGEDPYLCGELAKAAVKGFQGAPGETGKVVACAKHFVAYGGAEGGRDYNTCECTDNTLRNIYLPPFKAAVEAGVGTVMSGFHEIGGEPVSGSHYLLTQLLKDELGFNGFVVSDWASVKQLMHHGVAASDKEAALRAFSAGVDMDMADTCFMEHIKNLVEEGRISAERLDDAVRRILRIKFRAGLFENPYTDASLQGKVQLLEEHVQCARELAVQSMVLLKNENNLLPLAEKGKRIAVIGPMADAKRQLMGSWVMDGNPADCVTLVEGIRAVAPEADIITSSPYTDEMLIAIRSCDIVVLALGESHLRNGESANVTSLDLPVGQNELFEAVRSFGKPIVTIVFAGRPLAIHHIDRHSDALLYAWHPGIQGGAAAAEILFGHKNPSGKLPVTFPLSVGQIPIYYNHKNNGHDIDEYYRIGSRFNYQDLPGKPLYPFGYGLSYSDFRYSHIELDKRELRLGETVNISVKVRNCGSCPGVEVVQCYLRDLVSEVTRPVRELKGFKRVHLEPGEEKTVSFTFGKQELSYYGRKGLFTAEPGEYAVWVGGNCLAELEERFVVKGE